MAARPPARTPSPSRTAHPSPIGASTTPTAAKPVAKRQYHHGALRDGLVSASEAIILERGVEGFTLREAARRAGVSPAAPAHHFGDATGLLTEVARLGFVEFAAALRAADARGGEDPAQRLFEQGLAYVAFALRQPARFQLMFQAGKCDFTNLDLRRDARDAFAVLEDAIRALCGLEPGAPLTRDAHGALMAAWSLVHGFAHLALAGEIPRAEASPRDPAGERPDGVGCDRRRDDAHEAGAMSLLASALRNLSTLNALPAPGSPTVARRPRRG